LKSLFQPAKQAVLVGLEENSELIFELPRNCPGDLQVEAPMIILAGAMFPTNASQASASQWNLRERWHCCARDERALVRSGPRVRTLVGGRLAWGVSEDVQKEEVRLCLAHHWAA